MISYAHQSRLKNHPRTMPRVLCFGTYDLDKPRNRQMLEAFRQSGFEVLELHYEVWKGVSDKVMMSSVTKMTKAIRCIIAYPVLIGRYLFAPAHDVVFVGYLGHLDVLFLRPIAWLRGKPVIWDVFISIYDTSVCDRRMLEPTGVAAKLLWGWEWLACRCADHLVIDTKAHAAHLSELFGIAPGRVSAVLVGAEADAFPRLPPPERSEAPLVSVLFYGQFIPLHGIGTIIEAAKIDNGRRVRWHLIGRGQEQVQISAMIEKYGLQNIEWEEWVPYQTLIDRVARADVCLGIFGSSGKAGRVIPNKAFQILAAGRPLVTRDSPAIRELVPEDAPGVRLVPPSDPDALLAAILDLAASQEIPAQELSDAFRIECIGEDLRRLTLEVCGYAEEETGARQ